MSQCRETIAYPLAIKYNLTLDEFIAHNPQLQSVCNTNLWAGYAFCVLTRTRIPSSAPSTTAFAAYFGPTATTSSLCAAFPTICLAVDFFKPVTAVFQSTSLVL